MQLNIRNNVIEKYKNLKVFVNKINLDLSLFISKLKKNIEERDDSHRPFTELLKNLLFDEAFSNNLADTGVEFSNITCSSK